METIPISGAEIYYDRNSFGPARLTGGSMAVTDIVDSCTVCGENHNTKRLVCDDRQRHDFHHRIMSSNPEPVGRPNRLKLQSQPIHLPVAGILLSFLGISLWAV